MASLAVLCWRADYRRHLPLRKGQGCHDQSFTQVISGGWGENIDIWTPDSKAPPPHSSLHYEQRSEREGSRAIRTEDSLRPRLTTVTGCGGCETAVVVLVYGAQYAGTGSNLAGIGIWGTVCGDRLKSGGYQNRTRLQGRRPAGPPPLRQGSSRPIVSGDLA